MKPRLLPADVYGEFCCPFSDFFGSHFYAVCQNVSKPFTADDFFQQDN